MTVLVTGASGFVGRHLLPCFADRGAHVIALAERAPTPVEPGAPVETEVADIRDYEALARVLRRVRPRWIVHLAGQSSAALSFREPRETFAINAAGTLQLLEAVRAEAKDARVLLVGTSEAYGPQPEGTRAGEETPFRPVSPYALSKTVADVAGEAYGRAHGLDLVRTRSFSHLGPGQAGHFALPGFARQIAEAEAGVGEAVLRVGNLDVVRDLTDVRDVVDAYWRLCEHGRSGVAYNVCSGRGVRLADVVQALAGRARVGMRVEIDPARLRPADVPYLVGDPSRIQDDTGWRATTPLERSLDDLLEEWRTRVADRAVRDS